MKKGEKEQYKILRVTKIEHYYIPVCNGHTINGWDLDTVVEDWFRVPINDAHVTMCGHCVGNASYATKVEVVDKIDLPKDLEIEIIGDI